MPAFDAGLKESSSGLIFIPSVELNPADINGCEKHIDKAEWMN